MNNKIILLALIVLVGVLAGCNASKGLGEDIEQTGQNIKETVDKNR